MIRINASKKDEVLTALREEGLKNLLLEVWLEDFPLDRYAQLYRFGEKGYVLNVPSIATLFSYPDTYSLRGEEKLKVLHYAAPLIMGPHKIMHEIHELFPERSIRDTDLMGMNLKADIKTRSEAFRLHAEKNFRDLLELYMKVEEFRDSFSEYTEDGFVSEYMEAEKSGEWITTGLYVDGILVSAATYRFYEIENVCTAPGYRNRGFSRETLEELLSLIPHTKEGKRLILFTGNPVAEHLYGTLGFQNLGRFSKIS